MECVPRSHSEKGAELGFGVCLTPELTPHCLTRPWALLFSDRWDAWLWALTKTSFLGGDNSGKTLPAVGLSLSV